MPKVENYNAIYSVNADPKAYIAIDNYATVKALDETIADIKKQIKNVDKKHNRKNKDVEKLYDSLNTSLLQLESEVDDNESETQGKIDKLTNEFRDYMQYQEDTEKINDFCKKVKIKYNGIESYHLVLNKLYELVLKDRIQELKFMLKAVKAKDYRSCYTLDQTKKCISELGRFEDRCFYNNKLERLERIQKYREELRWKIK